LGRERRRERVCAAFFLRFEQHHEIPFAALGEVVPGHLHADQVGEIAEVPLTGGEPFFHQPLHRLG